jgi:PEP-CTERM motif
MARRGVIPFIAAALVCCSISRADTVTNLHMGDSVDLASYVNAPGTGILIGDKLFRDFTYITTDSTGLTNNLLPASAIALGPITGMVGFGLQFSGPFFTAQNVQKDFLISYSVTVTNAPMLISDVHLDYNGSFINNGFSIVTESAFDAGGIGGNLLGQIDVHNPPPVLSTNFFLSTPQPKLYIEKDIQLLSFSSSDIATISFIDQTFSQVAIPEPSSMMLVAGGLVGLWLWRRRY